MTDMATQGYVGVSRSVKERAAQHSCNLTKERGKRWYHYGLIKNFDKDNLEMLVVNCGTEDDMYHFEQQLRPIKGVGWNYAVGGKANGVSHRNFYIAGKGFSFREASDILGLSRHKTQKALGCYGKSVEEAFHLGRELENEGWCHYPTNTGYVKFLHPYEFIDNAVAFVKEAYAEEKNCAVLGKKLGCSSNVVLRIVRHVLKEPFQEVRQCCFNGVWFQFYTTLNSYELYGVVDMLSRGCSRGLISTVYGLKKHQVCKILRAWEKQNGGELIPISDGGDCRTKEFMNNK